MRPVSAALLRTVRSSHQVTVRATALTSWQTGVSPSGKQYDVAGGDVTYDATADVLATASVLLDGRGWNPRPGASLIQPYGTELYLEYGVLVNGATEWVGLGYGKISQVEQDAAPDGNLAVSTVDRMQGLIDAQVINPVQFTPGNSVADVFSQLVTAVYPSAVIDYDWDAADDLLGVSQVVMGDRHAFLADLATSRGKVMFFDYRGHLEVQSVPTGSSGPAVWAATAGPDGTLITGGRTLSRTNVYNAVAVTADGADTTTQAPMAVAYDSNPASPTYFYGPFGQVPETYSSPVACSAIQAAATAQTMLAKAIQLSIAGSFTCLPNPALEPWDVVRVSYGGRSSDENHLIDSLTIPLDPSDAMSGTGHDPSMVQTGVVTL